MKQRKKQGGITVFFSYAQADQAVCDQLSIHLGQLKRDGLIEAWSDQQILAGADRAQAIDQALHSAHIILLLISADFLASDACYQIEMQHALERHRRGEARVIPIIVRPCDWQHSPFGPLQCLPHNGQPISTWDNQDEAFLSIVQEVRLLLAPQPFSSPPLPPVSRRNRERLLKRVRTFWIEGLLEQSLHRAVWIDLHLQEQPDALENPWRLQIQELNQDPRSLPADTSILHVYDEADEELLILGEPGAGKTTLLLQLTRTLLDRAEADERQRLPIVFNLSSWAQKREDFAIWLVDELKTKYYVPYKVAEDWIEANQVLPLLDGLDEVAKEARVACVQAITAYYSHHPTLAGTPLVICCRSEEYRALSLHLPVQRAVRILPLADEQIEGYLSSAQGQLEGLRQVLHDDAELYELARRPLILSIFTLAYQGGNVVALPTESTNEKMLNTIFSSYVKRMLTRRGQVPSWMQKNFEHWLTSLARQMHQQQQTIFSVEDLQPDWLKSSQRRLYWWSFRLVAGLLVGLLGALLGALLGGLVVGLIFGLLVGLLGSLIGAYGKDSIGGRDKRIRPAEVISWSWKNARKGLFDGLRIGLLICVLFGLLGVLSGVRIGLVMGLVMGPSFGLLIGLIAGLVTGLSTDQLTEQARLSSNEGIRRSGKNGLVGGLLIGLLIGLPLWLSTGLLVGLLGGLLVGLLFGLLFGLSGGLKAFVQHFVLRFWLWRTNCLPWNLVPFLDEAAERLILHKVGGSYIFVHRLLLEYFSTLNEPASTENTSSKKGKA